MKKIIAAILALSMILAFAACGNPSTGDENQKNTNNPVSSDKENNGTPDSDEAGTRTLRVGVSKSIDTLTPFGIHSTKDAEHLIWEQLAAMDSFGGKMQGIIAKSWKAVDEGYVWDVEIYDYVYDTAGNHITAEDVEFSYAQVIGKGPMASCLSCKATGEYTVQIEITTASESTLADVMTAANIVSKKAFEASPDGMATNCIGTTPFVVTDFVAGGYVTLKKVDTYWQKDESLQGMFTKGITVDEITMVTIQEAAQQTIGLETDVVDAIDNLATTEVEKFEEGGAYAKDFTLLGRGNQQYTLVVFSGVDSSPCSDDLNLRMAVAYAIDVNGLIAGALDGRGEACIYHGNPVFNDVPTDKGPYFEYDVEKAKDYLAKSNYNNETIRIVHSNEGVYSKVCLIIANYLNAIGIKTEVTGYDNAMWQTVYPDATQYDIAVTGIGAHTGNTASWLNPFQILTSTGKTKAGNWDVEGWEELINAVNSTSGKTQENIDKFQDMLNENMYSRALYISHSYGACANDAGIVSAPIGYKGEILWWRAEFAG